MKNGVSRCLHVLQGHAGILIGSRVDEDRYTSQAGYQNANKLHPFRRQLDREKVVAGQITARPGEVRDETMSDRIVGDIEDDGDRRGRSLGRLRGQRAAGGDDDCHSTAN